MAEQIAAVIALIGGIAVGLTTIVWRVLELIHSFGESESRRQRALREQDDLNRILPTLPVGQPVNADSYGEAWGFSSFPPQEEALFRPFEGRIREIQKKNNTITMVTAGAIAVVALGIYFAIPPSKTDAATAQPAPVAAPVAPVPIPASMPASAPASMAASAPATAPAVGGAQ
jgi:hypothetical protein